MTCSSFSDWWYTNTSPLTQSGLPILHNGLLDKRGWLPRTSSWRQKFKSEALTPLYLFIYCTLILASILMSSFCFFKIVLLSSALLFQDRYSFLCDVFYILQIIVFTCWRVLLPDPYLFMPLRQGLPWPEALRFYVVLPSICPSVPFSWMWYERLKRIMLHAVQPSTWTRG